MSARSILLITSAMSAATLSIFACVGDAPAPGVGEPCGGGCAAGLSCVNDVCTASPADSGNAADAGGDGPTGADTGTNGDGGANDDGSADAAIDSCAYTKPPTPMSVVCPPGPCTTPGQRCCENAIGGGVACNTSCSFKGSPVLLACDGNEDCNAGEVCCLRQTALNAACPRGMSYDADAGVSTITAVITQCLPSASCAFRLCNSGGRCPVGETCVSAKLPTGAVIGVCE